MPTKTVMEHTDYDDKKKHNKQRRKNMVQNITGYSQQHKRR